MGTFIIPPEEQHKIDRKVFEDLVNRLGEGHELDFEMIFVDTTFERRRVVKWLPFTRSVPVRTDYRWILEMHNSPYSMKRENRRR
jgi:hypothetical protein